MTETSLQNLTNFTPDQENYIDWLSTPAPLRTPKTKTEYAEHLGKTRQALWLWEQTPGFDQERKHRIKRWQKESTPLIIESLKNKALEGDVQAIRVWLEWVEGIDNKLQIEHTMTQPIHFVIVDTKDEDAAKRSTGNKDTTMAQPDKEKS